jgi:hypothetical protein
VSKIAYLDICCFKRPFDDPTIERIRREPEAVAAILDMAQAGTLHLVRSPAHDFENERNPREDRRLATRLWLETLRSPSSQAKRLPIALAPSPLLDSALSTHCILHSPKLQRHDGS